MSALNCPIGRFGSGAVKAAIEPYQRLSGWSPAHSRLTLIRGPTSYVGSQYSHRMQRCEPESNFTMEIQITTMLLMTWVDS